MVGIYLIIALVTQLATLDGVVGALPLSYAVVPGAASVAGDFVTGSVAPKEPIDVLVEFKTSSDLNLGAPVFINGKFAGSVTRIGALDGENKDIQFAALLSINPNYRSLIRKGTVGLITTPLCLQRTERESVVELIVPDRSDVQPLENGASITGFTTFSELWSS